MSGLDLDPFDPLRLTNRIGTNLQTTFPELPTADALYFDRRRSERFPLLLLSRLCLTDQLRPPTAVSSGPYRCSARLDELGANRPCVVSDFEHKWRLSQSPLGPWSCASLHLVAQHCSVIMGRREHVYVHLRKRPQNMHNIHTPRNGDRIRRGFHSDLVKGDRRWIRKIMQTVAFTKQLADQVLSTGCRPCCAPIGKCCAEKVHLSRLRNGVAIHKL